MSNLLLDVRYGAPLGGVLPTTHGHLGSSMVVNSDYSLLAQIFHDRIAPEDVLVDVGCGKGRVLNWWLSQGHRNKMIGIELEQDVADRTRRRLRRYPNVSIIAGDAIELLPPEGTLFFLFNPFDGAATHRFKRAFEQRVADRSARVFYHAHCHLGVFLEDRAWQVSRCDLRLPQHGRFKEHHGSIAILRFKGRRT